MASPAPALLQLKAQIDAAYPGRDRRADGIMGDAAHQARVSDHNQGNALDVTFDAAAGPDLDALAEALMGDFRTHYVIWRRRIRNVEIEGGAWRPYNGADAHDHHLHLSIYAERREDTSPWAIGDGTAPGGDDAGGSGGAAGSGGPGGGPEQAPPVPPVQQGVARVEGAGLGLGAVVVGVLAVVALVGGVAAVLRAPDAPRLPVWG
jgi:hypothetical protein